MYTALRAEMARRNLKPGDLATIAETSVSSMRLKINGNRAFLLPEAFKITKAFNLSRKQGDEMTTDALFVWED